MSRREIVQRCSLVLLSCILALPGLGSAQQEKKVVLEHADSLIGLVIDGEQARQLVGNVKFTQGTVVVTCRKAIQYLNSNKIMLKGEAELWDGKMHMITDSGMYYGDSKTAEAFGRVMLEDTTTTLTARYGKYFADEKKAYFTSNVEVEDALSFLTADELTYYREDQTSIAVGNVKILNKKNGLEVYGDRFENFKKRKSSTMTGHPKVVLIDTTSGGKRDTLTVTGRMMEAYQDSVERLVVYDSVSIVRGEVAAEAGQCIFYTELDSMILRKAPFVWYTESGSEGNQVSGDSIFIKLLQRKLNTVYVRGSAFAISQADSQHINRYNQMSGEEIVMSFDSSKIHRIDVDKTATSLYYLFDGKEPNGVNKTTGDHITMTFKESRIDKIKVIGGVEGDYYPEKMIANRESDYNLTGFNWKERKSNRR